MKNRYLPILGMALLVVIAASSVYVLNANSGKHPTTSANTTQSRLKVLGTFFPVYDFARNVGGDRVDVSILVPETVDVHQFEPNPSTVQEVAAANVLIFSGAGLEPWVPQLISAVGNPNLVVVDSSAGIPLLPVPSRFQKDNRSIDPHIWLDPLLAKIQVTNILRGLVQADPADEAYFTAKAQAYEARLDFLNAEIVNATANVKTRYFVTFHEAFGYFARQYGLTQIPIAGPFEEDPTPNEIQSVVTAINQNHLCYVGYESLENPALSQSIASQTRATLVLMDPIEGLTQADQNAGKTYLIKMQENLQVFALVLYHVGC
jgi:zinc transport system substrate-binding protein